jgi:hypothetical protein
MQLLPVLAIAVVSALPGLAQSVMVGVGSTVHLVNEDLALLEAQIPRKDLPCRVVPQDPEVGFDLRFHGGYEVSMPLKELAGQENQLRILFRVTAESRADEPVFFVQNFRVPEIPEDAGGDTTLGGTFDLGEGKYHVDWLMRDRQNRACAFFWDAKAELPRGDRDMELAITANAIQAAQTEQFLNDPPVQRNAGALLNVKVMVNFAPQNQNSSAMRPIDTLARVTMMRRITRDPRIGKFSLVAFNIQEQRVAYRQGASDKIDFQSMGKAISDIEPGKIDLKLLANKRGEEEFLTDLIKTELASADRPDALIFAGPKYMVTQGSPENDLKNAESVDYPVFYLNYNLNPAGVPWRDSIGRAIRVFGGKEYTITKPRDLFFAVTEMVGRIVESRKGRGGASAPKQ